MTALSFIHSGHDGHTGNHGSTGEHLGGHAHGAHHGHAAVKTGHSGAHHGVKAKSVERARFMISPLDVFSLCLGAGATGELLKLRLPGDQVLLLAVVGALVFNFLVVKPVMGALLRFASEPSDGLEGYVSKRAEAVTRFDDAGRGLVRLHLDGQIVQLLGTLDADELQHGIRVLKGDPLIVIDVDPARNSCRVTRELAS